jgi:hypothetical protein
MIYSAMTADALPEDPGTLKAMLIAERAQNDRLRQIIKELQRHRFGRRAEFGNETIVVRIPVKIDHIRTPIAACDKSDLRPSLGRQQDRLAGVVSGSPT